MSTTTPTVTDLACQEVQSLLQAARQGDLQTLARLRDVLQANPALWQESGDLALQAERAWIGALTGDNLVFRESLVLKVSALKADLAESTCSPSPLEKLLIDQIALSWLEFYGAAARDAQSTGQSLTTAHRDFLLRRVDRAQRRLQAGLKNLATVRKLLRPPLSPFDLSRQPVTETTGNKATRSRRASSPEGGAVQN